MVLLYEPIVYLCNKHSQQGSPENLGKMSLYEYCYKLEWNLPSLLEFSTKGSHLKNIIEIKSITILCTQNCIQITSQTAEYLRHAEGVISLLTYAFVSYSFHESLDLDNISASGQCVSYPQQ